DRGAGRLGPGRRGDRGGGEGGRHALLHRYPALLPLIVRPAGAQPGGGHAGGVGRALGRTRPLGGGFRKVRRPRRGPGRAVTARPQAVVDCPVLRRLGVMGGYSVVGILPVPRRACMSFIDVIVQSVVMIAGLAGNPFAVILIGAFGAYLGTLAVEDIPV